MHPGTLIAALVSAALSYASLTLVPKWSVGGYDAGDVLPGILYGLLVLASRSLGGWATLFVVVLCGLLHLGARETALHLYSLAWPTMAACAVAGMVAAFVLSVVYSRLTHKAAAWANNLRAAAFGGAAGILVGFGLEVKDETVGHVLILSGYALWQYGFALVHAIVPRWWPAPRTSGAEAN